MRILLRAIVGLALLCVFIAAVGFGWFYLYSGDLPSFATLATFAPPVPTTVADDCSPAAITVVPYSEIAQSVRDATRAAEGDDRALSVQIARGMFCNYRGRMLQRHILEYKASVQLRHEFTSEQLLTIYLNRAYFGDSVVGVESASHHYYGRRASELDVGQAAMIAGLLKAPTRYSPKLHPERARARRDAVIALMLSKGVITPAQANAAMQDGSGAR